MRDSAPPPDLALEALLYASGELEGAEAVAFEERLGADQAAREALCQAVHLSQTVGRQPAPGPDRSGRERVRQRLRQPSRWEWLLHRRTYRGHPALWVAVGAAAAVLLVIGLAQLPPNLMARPHPPLPPPREGEPVVPTPLAEPAHLASTEVPAAWTTLPMTERLSKARDEEMRRRLRNEERQRLSKPADRRRSISEPPPRY